MPDHQTQQKLAAILFADVAGYSQLMDQDEAATYEAWRKARGEVVEPTITGHRGRIVKYTGDGFLAEFTAAETAVTCAVKLQEAFAGRDPLKLRMGVHLGDVYPEGDDLYGDGVNVASRLEGLAEPGGICISGTVHDLVRKKVTIEFVDGGKQPLKHIAEPIQVWHVRAKTALAAAATSSILSNLSTAMKRPGIAVLPFANMSQDPDQEYFADGLAEDLITDLSRTGTLFVIARNSTFVYKGRAVDVPKVARELGVRYVLEGSVRRAGQRIRVNAQLIDGTTGGHLWAERYDRDLTDIFAVQDEITGSIVTALSLSLVPGTDQRVAQQSTTSVEAYDLFLRGRDLLFQTKRSSTEQARPLFERAIAIDPTFASAHALLAQVYMLYWLNGWGTDAKAEQQRSLEYSETAMRLNPSDPYGYWTAAATSVWMKDFERALALSERALAVDPTFVTAYSTYGGALLGLNRAAEALEIFSVVNRADPHAPTIMLHFQARALFLLARYDEAASVLRDRIAKSPETDISRALLAAAYGHLGRLDDAGTAWADLLKVNPNYSLATRRDILPTAEFDSMVKGLVKAGLVDAETEQTLTSKRR